MKLDVGDFKKLSENEHSAILQHPKGGHKIVIAKKILSSKQAQDLKKMPLHYDEGTKDGPVPANSDAAPNASYDPSATVAPAPEAAPVAPAPTAPSTPTVVINNTPAQPQAPAPVPVAAPVPQAPIPQAAPQNPYAPQNDPYGSNAYGMISKEGLNNQVQGIQGEAAGQNTINQAQVKALGQGTNMELNQFDKTQAIQDGLRQEYHGVVNDAQNGMIHPTHYLDSLSTGQKIVKGIGLILGGFGHGSNAAADILNNQIHNDIQAQVQNQNTRLNLVSANMNQFGNETSAAQMAEVQLRGIVSNQLQQAALRSGNPMLIARAQQAAGQLELQNNQLMSQIAVRQTLQSGSGPQGGQAPQQNPRDSIDPSTKIRLYGMIGQMSPTQVDESQKQLQQAQGMNKVRDNLLNAFEQLSYTDSVSNRITSPVQTPKKVAAIKGPLLAQLVKDSEGRITPTDLPLIEAFFPKYGDNEETLLVKKQQMNKFVQEKMNFPLLKSYGINPNNNSNFNSQGQNKVQEGPPVFKR